MAFLYVIEATDIKHLQGDGAQAISGIGKAAYRIDNTAASTQGPLLNTATKYVQLHTDSICSFEMGVNPTAVVGAKRMAAGETRTYEIDGSAGDVRIAAVFNT